MNGIKVGIIGIGNIGSAHLNCIYNGKIVGMNVKAVCDIDEIKLKNVANNYSDVKTFSDYKELITVADIDTVIVAVPHPLHADIAIFALNNNKNVLLEKPVDITVTKAKKVNCIAENSEKLFGIMLNQRTNELFSKAREIVKDGKLGELKRSVWIVTNWYRMQSYYDSGSWRATWNGEGGGVLLNQAPHNLDLWQWICGMPKTVTAFCNVGKFHNIEVEDEATIFTEYENGATGVFITSTGDYPGTNRLEICGTKGKIVIENGVLKYWKLKTDEREFCKNYHESFDHIDGDYFEYSFDTETGHSGILQNFANAILKGEKLLAPGIDGINELTISNAAYLSEWLGNKKIDLPFDNKLFDSQLAKRQKNSKFKLYDGGENLGNYNSRWLVRW